MQSSKLSLVVDRADGQISIAEAIAFVSSAEFGAVDIFVGHVRNVNLGRDVDGISYDMFDALVMLVLWPLFWIYRQVTGWIIKLMS